MVKLGVRNCRPERGHQGIVSLAARRQHRGLYCVPASAIRGNATRSQFPEITRVSLVLLFLASPPPQDQFASSSSPHRRTSASASAISNPAPITRCHHPPSFFFLFCVFFVFFFGKGRVLPCVVYFHGGAMMALSSFYGFYQAWGKLLASRGV